VESKCGHSTLGLRVFQKFEVVQDSLALGESSEDIGPATLLLVAMGELDMCVRQRISDCQLVSTNSWRELTWTRAVL
jgi:hypothetical protein